MTDMMSRQFTMHVICFFICVGANHIFGRNSPAARARDLFKSSYRSRKSSFDLQNSFVGDIITEVGLGYFGLSK